MTQSPVPATWSTWTEATAEQRAHFKTLPQHKAWSRICDGCGEGDFLERKQRPTIGDHGLSGRGFPKLPQPTGEGVRNLPFRTPIGRRHTCVTAQSAAATRRAELARRYATHR